MNDPFQMASVGVQLANMPLLSHHNYNCCLLRVLYNAHTHIFVIQFNIDERNR